LKTSIFSLIILGGSLGWGTTIWNESGDAGKTPDKADITTGNGFLTEILGKVPDGAAGGDIFAITITDPAAFSALTINLGKKGIQDPSLYLFDSNGRGVEAVDSNGAVQANLTAGNAHSPISIGTYYILITTGNNEPQNNAGVDLFADTPGGGIVGPTLNGMVKKFSGNGTGDSGDYEIDLTGAAFDVQTPEPASMLLIGGGLLLVGLWKRVS
jgi:hypothetical protein